MLPFQVISNHIVTTIDVNKHPMKIILDTGSFTSDITESEARSYGLPVTQQTVGEGGMFGQVIYMHPGNGWIDLSQNEKSPFWFGYYAVPNQDWAMGYPLLGLNFFRMNRLDFSVNWQNMTLSIWKAGAATQPTRSNTETTYSPMPIGTLVGYGRAADVAPGYTVFTYTAGGYKYNEVYDSQDQLIHTYKFRVN